MSLIHWWPLINDTHDNGTAALNLTTVGSLGFTGAGKIGGTGATFTGDSQALKATDLSTLHSFTKYSMACWVKLTANATNHSSSFLSSGNWNSSASQVCFGLYNPNGNGYTKLLVPNTSGFTGGITLNTAIALNVWHHYIITYDGTTTKGYIDGTYVGSYSGGGISTTEVTYYYLGAATYYSGFTMKGVMNDFRIYDHTLSVLEINELAKGLVLHYDFEDPYIESTTNYFYNKVIGFTDGDRWKIVTDYPTGITPQYRVYKQTSSNSYFGSASTFLANTSSPTSYNSKKFTLSGWYYRPSTNAQPPYIAVFGNNGSTSYASVTNVLSTSNLNVIGSWTPFYITIQFNSNLSNFSSLTYIKSPEGLNDPLYLADLQFEEKDHATPFARGARSSELCYDSSGYNYHGTLSDSTAQVKETAAGHGKHALLINASTTITHPQPLGQTGQDQEWTVNTWIYPTAMTGGNTLLNNFNIGNYLDGNSSSHYLLLYCNSGSNDYYKYSNMALSLNTWYMVTFVFKNSTLLRKIYINAVDKTGDGPNSGVCRTIPSTITCFTNFAGYVGDYQIYATALSADQITTLYKRKAAVARNNTIIANQFVSSQVSQELMYGLNFGVNGIRNQYGHTTHDTDGSVVMTGKEWLFQTKIPVIPNETLYYDITYSHVSGNLMYIGFEYYNINGGTGENQSTRYITYDSNAHDHTRIKGTITIPETTQGAATGSIQLRILNDWSGANGRVGKIHNFSLRRMGPAINPNIDVQSVIQADDFREYNYNNAASIYKDGFVAGTQLIEN